MSSCVFVYGLHAVKQLLESSPKRAISLRVVDPKKGDRKAEVVALAKKHRVRIEMVRSDELESDLESDCVHQGVVLVCQPLARYDDNGLLALLEKKRAQGKRCCVLALDGVQDPRNLGACLRSAAAFGVDAVLLPKDKSASLTATAEKVACGGAALVPLVTVTNLSRTLKKLQDERFWVIGLAGEGEQLLSEVDLSGDVVIVMGNEEKGIRQNTAKHCDYLARIPMLGGVSSLNVSAATTVALYEMVRQS